MTPLRLVTPHPHLMLPLSLPLHPHPDTPCPEVASITVAAALDGATALHLNYRLNGRIDQLLIPPPHLSGHADNLWEHTCFEAFITRSDLTIYHELNFSPSGQWARYAFSAYRQRAGIPAGLPPPEFSVCLSPEHLELHILLATAGFPEAAPDSCWQLGISAVIENRQGEQAYWALSHAGPTPDFHQRTTFLLNLK